MEVGQLCAQNVCHTWPAAHQIPFWKVIANFIRCVPTNVRCCKKLTFFRPRLLVRGFPGQRGGRGRHGGLGGRPSESLTAPVLLSSSSQLPIYVNAQNCKIRVKSYHSRCLLWLSQPFPMARKGLRTYTKEDMSDARMFKKSPHVPKIFVT